MRIFLTGGSGFIGTNLVTALVARGDEVLDYSHSPPRNRAHAAYTILGDLLDGERLRKAMSDFEPEAALHLAARTDCVETVTVEEGYRSNTEGTRHFLEAVRVCPSVRRTVIFSSQYVCGPGRLPRDDEDVFPHTVYGQSKVITEKLTRAADLPCVWTLVRPTNIWGPWHSRYPQEFWRIAHRGLYFHPGGQPVRRCYGYVGNVVWQTLRILELPEEKVHRQTFYLGDEPDDIYRWANGFCLRLSGRPAPKVPRPLLRLAAAAGDVMSALIHRNFYITSSRYRSMTTDYLTPMEKTFEVVGRGPYSLNEGIEETAQWLQRHLGWPLPPRPSGFFNS